MADKVLAILKFSYDNLENQKLKSCFLYCSLFPEDFAIGKNALIGFWSGEGFLDKFDDLNKVQNEGHDVIRCLKDVCLLETGILLGAKMENMVKMHDVVRDLAIWVASDLGRNKGIYLTIKAQSTLNFFEWEKAERISLINNIAIKELEGTPECSNLLTLFLRNSSVSVISDDFFLLMPRIKVLAMNMVELKNLPTSIFTLSELQFLQLPSYDKDVVLAPGSISSLKKLKILGLSESCCQWEVEGGLKLCEIESLQHLISLRIAITTGFALQRLVTSRKLQMCTKFLTIKYCAGITSLTFLQSLSSSTDSLVSLVNMIRLSILVLENCAELKELRIISKESRDKDTLFTILEDLYLLFLPNLKITWGVPQQSFYSANLRRVIIKGCPKLKDLTWIIYVQNIEILVLFELDGLKEIISNESATKEKLANTFSRLNYLQLYSLKKLKRICDHNVEFFLLDKILVKGCPELKKLPFNANSLIPHTLKKIEGEKQWWESLEWEDEATKSNLDPYFCEPALPEDESIDPLLDHLSITNAAIGGF